MNIPKKIKAGAVTYSTEVSKLPAQTSKCWGTTLHGEQIIHIDEAIKPDRQAETFLHELLHVALWQSGLSQLIDDKVPLTEEHIVNTMTASLYQILRDNKLDFTEPK